MNNRALCEKTGAVDAGRHKIGIFGGTFNPVHRGHLAIAAGAVRKLGLDRIFFVPAHIPPHKKVEGRVSAADRAEMVRLAIKRRPGFGLSLYEIGKKRTSYSIDTIRYFRRKCGRTASLFFIIGADSLSGLSEWKSVDKALRLAQFAVFNRPGHGFGACPRRVKRFRVKGVNVSSSAVRDALREGRLPGSALPVEVMRYIRSKGLYGTRKTAKSAYKT